MAKQSKKTVLDEWIHRQWSRQAPARGRCGGTVAAREGRMTNPEFASLLATDTIPAPTYQAVILWRAGLRMPGSAYAARIEAVTEGSVTEIDLRNDYTVRAKIRKRKQTA